MEQALIEEIARIAGATLVDLQEGLYDRPDLLPDALHPNAEGAGILARTVYGALTGDYGGLQLPDIYSDRMLSNKDLSSSINFKRFFSTVEELVKVTISTLCSFNKAFISSYLYLPFL